jgi:hypothetical protein
MSFRKVHVLATAVAAITLLAGAGSAATRESADHAAIRR